MSSLRLVPSAPAKIASVKDTANDFGLHDTLQYGPRSIAAETRLQNPLQHRLQNWAETQDNLKLTMQRDLHGIHAPMRLLMERKLVSTNPHMPSLPRSNLHLDILMGRDEQIDVGDIFNDGDTRQPLNIHAEMEKKLKM